MTEKEMYTVAEVAAKMGVSESTIIRLFEKEPCVPIVQRPRKLNKQRYRSIRIPRHVYER